MASIELNALETLNIRAWRTEDEAGEVTLVIRTDDGTVRVRCGRTADDADRLTEALALATGQSAKAADDWDERPDENDLYVTLDRYRYWVSWDGRDQPGQPRNGYPDRQVAVYEAARWMAGSGEFPAAWISGEHGPAAASIDSEIRAFHDEGGSQLLPLDGVEYEPGDRVRYNGDEGLEVVRDYGSLGLWLAVAGDHSAGEAFVTDRSRIQPVYEPGQVIEYVTSRAPAADTWAPGTFQGYAGEFALVRKHGSDSPVELRLTRRVPSELLSAARSWIADCEWADLDGAGDVADLTDTQVVTGIENHYTGGWAEFRRAVQ